MKATVCPRSMPSQCIGAVCWRSVLAQYIGAARWRSMLAQCVGAACWRSMLAQCFGAVRWRSVLAQYIGAVCWRSVLAQHYWRSTLAQCYWRSMPSCPSRHAGVTSVSSCALRCAGVTCTNALPMPCSGTATRTGFDLVNFATPPDGAVTPLAPALAKAKVTIDPQLEKEKQKVSKKKLADLSRQAATQEKTQDGIISNICSGIAEAFFDDESMLWTGKTPQVTRFMKNNAAHGIRATLLATKIGRYPNQVDRKAVVEETIQYMMDQNNLQAADANSSGDETRVPRSDKFPAVVTVEEANALCSTTDGICPSSFCHHDVRPISKHAAHAMQ